MSEIENIVGLLGQEASWRGFPEIRRYLRGGRTRARLRALAGIMNQPAISQRPDFHTRQVRIAVVGSRSTENLRDPITVEGLERGLFCNQYHADFGQFSQEIRNSASGLYRFQPDLVTLIPQVANYLPQNSALSENSGKALVDALCAELSMLREKFSGPVLVQNFLAPEAQPWGILDNKKDLGTADFYRFTNYWLSQRLTPQAGVLVLDADHVSRFTATPWTTLHTGSYVAGHAIPEQLAGALARDIAAAGAALKGFARKCLVVDLDNTLWGGVVGEDGTAGIQIGGAFPGNIYADLQRHMKTLLGRGILLAINSKNNPEDARAVFEHRREVILQWQDFACIKVNWNDKVSNLREIAGELNLGLDSMAVLDDNPVEREWIETSCPEVYVFAESDPLGMLRALSVTRIFDTLAITAEDKLRQNSYAAAHAREQLKESKSDLSEYLHSLEMVVEIGTPDEAHMGRVAQLTQKTNQFNLTTRRYSEDRLRQFLDSNDWEVFYCACRDRFADEGIIGVAVVNKKGQHWSIDTFLLSCRVLGRGVESAFLSSICNRAQLAGARYVLGEFIRSGKNAQTENFYLKNGFAPLPQSNGSSRFQLDLSSRKDKWPDWIACKENLAQSKEASW